MRWATGDIDRTHSTFSTRSYYIIAMTTKVSGVDGSSRMELELALYIAKRKTGSVKDYITYIKSVLSPCKPGRKERKVFKVILKIPKWKEAYKQEMGLFKPGPMSDIRAIQAISKSFSSELLKPRPTSKMHTIQTDSKSYRSRSYRSANVPLISLESFPQGLKLPTKISVTQKEWFLELFHVDYSLQSLNMFKQSVSRSGNPAPLSFDNLFKYLDLLRWVSATGSVGDERRGFASRKIWSVFQNQFPMLLHNDTDSKFSEMVPNVLKRVSEIVLQSLNNNSLESTIDLTMHNYITYIYEPIFTNVAGNLVFFDDSVDILKQLVDSFLKIVGCCLLMKLGLLQSSETLRDTQTLRRLEQILQQRASTSPTQSNQLHHLRDIFITPAPFFSTPLNLQKFISQTSTGVWLRLATFYLDLMQSLMKLLWKVKLHCSLTDDLPYIVARSRLKILAFMLALEDTELMAFYLSMNCWSQ